jgi:type I restriction enzyme S subunit
MTVDRTAASETECRTLPYVGLEHIEKNTGRFTADFRRTPEILLATKYRFSPRHVLYGKLRPNLNKTTLPDFDGVCTTEILPLLPDPPMLDRSYLYAALLSQRFVKWASNSVSGANLPRLDPERLLQYEIELPDLSEQQRIAGRLEQADRLVRTRRYTLELTEVLLPGAFKELFGDISSRTTSFESAAVGDVAERVVVGHVGETAEYYRESGVAFLRTQNVRRMSINRDGIRYVTPEFGERSRKSTLRSGDVVVSRVGANRGMAAVVPADLDGANCANILVVTPGNRLIPGYLAFLINSPQGLTELTGDSVGSAQGVINTSTLQAWLIPVPPLTRQREFAQVVEQVETLRAVQREALRQAEHLFASLLHHAFSG